MISDVLSFLGVMPNLTLKQDPHKRSVGTNLRHSFSAKLTEKTELRLYRLHFKILSLNRKKVYFLLGCELLFQVHQKFQIRL